VRKIIDQLQQPLRLLPRIDCDSGIVAARPRYVSSAASSSAATTTPPGRER
jgi:hypothetical protein